MSGMTISDFLFTLAGVMTVLGAITLGIGVYVLVVRAAGPELRMIADQTAKLAQKGIAEDVAGLVGNASSLVESLNQLVKTATGVGAFLIFVSLAMFGAVIFIVLQLR